MPTNGKYKGNAVTFTINSVEYAAECKSVNIVNEESEDDFVTFADAASGGGVQWFLDLEAQADYAGGTLWEYLWTNSGNTAVAFVVKPYGNAVATADKPHFTGTVNLGPKPPVGGEASAVWSFEYRAEINGTPVRKTTA